MTSSSYIHLLLLMVAVVAHGSRDNNSFPDGFMFGASTSAYQVEGGWNEDGKGESIWDYFLHKHPELSNHQNGDVAADSYHKYKEDVKLLKDMGMSHYRFSIAWPRVLPTGEANNINQAGIDYYNNLINELLANGIEPLVTIYHQQLPQWLQDLGGWTNPIITDYFEDYARVVFENFGDRVKWWVTLNEPYYIVYGYSQNDSAPGVHKPGVADYLAAHNIIIAHARAYHLYDKEFRSKQQGQVSITLNCEWYEPLDNSSASDLTAVDRALQFMLGIFAHPIYSTEGDYPAVVRESVDNNSKAEGRTRSRLPVFSKEEVEYIRGTYDYFALNYYTTRLATIGETGASPSLDRDAQVVFSKNSSWPSSPTNFFQVVPWGLRKLINWIHKEYNAPTIIITENGYADDGTLEDTARVNFIKGHLAAIQDAIYEDGCNVTGYTIWSLIDDFEWTSGYRDKFGLAYVDFSDPERPRTPKASYSFMKEVTQTRALPES